MDDDRRDRLQWRFSGGDATTPAELGQPQSSTTYALCIYGGADATRFAKLELPAGSPGWRATPSGVRYAEETAAVDGVRTVQIKVRGERTRLIARGRGEALPDVDLSALAGPVLVQLNNNAGGCWQSEFAGSEILSNTAEQMRAKGGD
jgi:hypothetical protein